MTLPPLPPIPVGALTDGEAALLRAWAERYAEAAIEHLSSRVQQLQSELEREHADHQETLRDVDAMVAAERERWRPAAEKARAALSELLTSRDPIVYSEALAALDAVLTPNASLSGGRRLSAWTKC